MLFVRFKCNECGAMWKKLRLFATSQSTADCPKCGHRDVPLMRADMDRLRLEEKSRCSGFS